MIYEIYDVDYELNVDFGEQGFNELDNLLVYADDAEDAVGVVLEQLLLEHQIDYDDVIGFDAIVDRIDTFSGIREHVVWWREEEPIA